MCVHQTTLTMHNNAGTACGPPRVLSSNYRTLLARVGDTYGPSLNCTLTIVAPESSMRLRVTFSIFLVTSGDVLTVYDGASTSGNLIANKTDSAVNLVLATTGQTMTLRFVTGATPGYG